MRFFKALAEDYTLMSVQDRITTAICLIGIFGLCVVAAIF